MSTYHTRLFFKNQMKSYVQEKFLGKLYSMSNDSCVKCMSYMSLWVNYHHFFRCGVETHW